MSSENAEPDLVWRPGVVPLYPPLAIEIALKEMVVDLFAPAAGGGPGFTAISPCADALGKRRFGRNHDKLARNPRIGGGQNGLGQRNVGREMWAPAGRPLGSGQLIQQ